MLAVASHLGTRLDIEYLDFFAGDLTKPDYATVNPNQPNFLKQESDKEAVRLAQGDLARFAPVLDAHLKGRQFLVGNNVTLADYSMIHLEKSVAYTAALPANKSKKR